MAKTTSPTTMEPLLPDENKALSDLATDLVAKSNALAGRLHPLIQQGMGDLVRSMNCYYSNLIEGHDTHPIDIDRALAGDYSAERIPPAPGDLAPFLERFATAYGNERLPKIQRIIGVAASHHRLLWIHPFADGNGRVGRLFSHAFLKELGIGSSLWSVSRGLARAVDKYKAVLQAADEPRRGDLAGRGNLTQAGLVDFCTFFLSSCVDQVIFMESLFEPTELQRRMEIWCEEEVRADRLPKGSWALLREALLAGEFIRGKAPELTGYQERQARTVLNTLIEKGFLVSSTSRAPVRLGFPLTVVDRWFPRLYIGTAGTK
ncbi:Fic family protein [Bradyrhizobium sp. USDA 10063]